MAEQKVFRRPQHRKIQNTHGGAGIIFSWDACGLQGEALCCSLPRISSLSVYFTQLRDIKAWRASKRHWSQTWPLPHPGRICPGRAAFLSRHFPSAIINLQRTGAAWKFYSASMSLRPVYKVRGRNKEQGPGQHLRPRSSEGPRCCGHPLRAKKVFAASYMNFAWK